LSIMIIASIQKLGRNAFGFNAHTVTTIRGSNGQSKMDTTDVN
jgi:hypothetical protein